MKLLLSMGIPRRNNQALREGFRFGGAIIQIIDWERKKIIKEISYSPPPEHLPRGLSIQFKGAYLSGDDLYVVTNTEVLKYDISSWKLDQVFSHPSFNDLHAVLYKDGQIYLCNTGLEMVQVLDQSGSILEEINMSAQKTWERFERGFDYRTIPTTKPHEAHINHLFELNGMIWVTRGQKGDAVCLYDKAKSLPIIRHKNNKDTILCHDGKVTKDSVYFTAVDGRVIVLDMSNHGLRKEIDLNRANPSGRLVPWTRGIEVVGRFAFIGVTKMRTTKFRELASWAMRGQPIKMPSAILQLDLLANKIIDIYEIENHKGAAIYSIINLGEK